MTSPLCCPWVSWDDLTPEQQAKAQSREVFDAWALVASETLFLLTQSRWRGAGCHATAVIQSRTGSWPYSDSWGACGCWSPGVGGGNVLGGGWGGTHVGAPIAIQLPHNATRIIGVKLGTVEFDAYELQPGGWLRRTDGMGWPVCGPYLATVEYAYGDPPPAGGVKAALALALELTATEVGGKCRLPSRVTSVTRQGVTLQRAANFDRSDAATPTGIPEVDLWIRSVNPYGSTRRGRFVSVDIPAAVPSVWA